MKKLHIANAVALLSALAACSQQLTEQPETDESRPDAGVAQTYSASGAVTAVSGQGVTISHGPVDGLGWPAMTMTFQTANPDVLAGIAPGDQVAFAFHEADGAYVVTSLTKN